MGIVGGETTRWPNMSLLHHHDSPLIVDKDNVLVTLSKALSDYWRSVHLDAIRADRADDTIVYRRFIDHGWPM